MTPLNHHLEGLAPSQPGDGQVESDDAWDHSLAFELEEVEERALWLAQKSQNQNNQQ